MQITFPLKNVRRPIYLESLKQFANDLIRIQEGIDFRMSARGWCYAVEPYGLNKGDFNWMQKQINEARKEGYLKPGFIFEEEGHKVTEADDYEYSPEDYVNDEYDTWQGAEDTFRNSHENYTGVSFWKDKNYFIQMLVEKSDLKSLFAPVCEKYYIPLANMRGWGSMEQKATMAKNFMEAEGDGKTPVLLVCCDFDPPGLSISGILNDTFVKHSKFSGWYPHNLIVERVGLNYDFIIKNKLTWIDQIHTISGRNLADPNHKFYKSNTYDIQGYIEKYGERKCEANAIVVAWKLGREMLVKRIEKYVGEGAYDKYIKDTVKKRKEVKELIDKKLEEEGL